MSRTSRWCCTRQPANCFLQPLCSSRGVEGEPATSCSSPPWKIAFCRALIDRSVLLPTRQGGVHDDIGSLQHRIHVACDLDAGLLERRFFERSAMYRGYPRSFAIYASEETLVFETL